METLVSTRNGVFADGDVDVTVIEMGKGILMQLESSKTVIFDDYNYPPPTPE